MPQTPVSESKTKKFAKAISIAEGFGINGAVPTRANNPGDLVLGGPSTGANISKFNSVDEGWDKLHNQLRMIKSGKSKIYSNNDTISSMAKKWTETEPDGWADNVAKHLGVSKDTKLNDLLDELDDNSNEDDDILNQAKSQISKAEQDAVDDDILKQVKSKTSPKSEEKKVEEKPSLFSRLKETGEGLLDTAKKAALVTSGYDISHGNVAAKDLLSGFTAPFSEYTKDIKEPNAGFKPEVKFATRMLGGSPENISSDYENSHYGALAGDLLGPAAAGFLLHNITKGIGNKADLPVKPKVSVLPELESPRPRIQYEGDVAKLGGKQVPDWNWDELDKGKVPNPDLHNTPRNFGVQKTEPKTLDVKGREVKNPIAGEVIGRTVSDDITAPVPDRLKPEVPTVSRFKSTLPSSFTDVVKEPVTFENEVDYHIRKARDIVREKLDISDTTHKKYSGLTEDELGAGKGVESNLPKNVQKPIKASINNNTNPEIKSVLSKAPSSILGSIRNSKYYESIYKPLAVGRDTELNRMGKSGKYLSKYVEDTNTQGNQLGGELASKFRGLSRDLSKEEQGQVVSMLDGKATQAPNLKVQEAYKILRAELDNLGKQAEESGMNLRLGTETIPFKMHEGEYFPHYYPEGFFEDKEALVSKLINKGMSQAEATKIADNARKYGEKLIGPQHARTLDVEGYHTDLSVLEKYGYDMGKRITEAKRYGGKDIGDINSPISTLIESTENPARAREIMSQILDREEKSSPASRNTASAIIRAEAATKLSQFAINNISDLATIPARTSIKAFMKGIKDTLSHPHLAADEASETGALAILRREAIKDVQSGDLLGKAYGIGPIEKSFRTIGALAGKAHVQDLFNKLKANPTDVTLRAKFARFVDGNIDDILQQEKLTRKQINFAGGRTVELTSSTPNKLNLPPAFTEGNPLFRLPLLFKRYMVTNTKNMVDAVKTEPTLRGKSVIAGKYLGYYMLAGEVSGDAKATIDGIVKSIIKHDSSQVGESVANRRSLFPTTGSSVADRLIADAGQSWMLGILGDIGEGVMRGSQGVAGLMMGPVGSDFMELGQDVSSGAKGNYNSIGRSVVRRTPFIGPGLAKSIYDKPEKKPNSNSGASVPRIRF